MEDFEKILDNSNISKIILFVSKINQLKKTIRFSTLKDKLWDDVAAHSRRLAVFSFLIAREVDKTLDIFKVVMIALMHDLAETITWDVDVSLIYTWKATKEEKFAYEDEVIKKLLAILPEDLKDEIYEYRKDDRHGISREAKFVKAMDKFEWTLQYIQEDYDSPFLPYLKEHWHSEVKISWNLDKFHEKMMLLWKAFIQSKWLDFDK